MKTGKYFFKTLAGNIFEHNRFVIRVLPYSKTSLNEGEMREKSAEMNFFCAEMFVYQKKVVLLHSENYECLVHLAYKFCQIL
jgi:hypothetical protein